MAIESDAPDPVERMRALSDALAATAGFGRYELQQELDHALTQFRGRALTKRRVDAAADSAGSIVDAARRAEESATLIGSISAVSELCASAERWLLELIGEALADADGPSWGEIGKSLRKLSRSGAVVPAPISRQAARQRFADFPLVERHRLIGRLSRLERQIAALGAQVRMIQADPARNRAEKDRDVALAREQIAERALLVTESQAQLETLSEATWSGTAPPTRTA